jgi:hypothetical protein
MHFRVGGLQFTVRRSQLWLGHRSGLLKTELNTYRASDGDTFYSAGVKPTVPTEISSKISGVIGLTSSKARAPLAKVVKAMGEEPAPHSATIRTDSAGGTGPGGTYSCKEWSIRRMTYLGQGRPLRAKPKNNRRIGLAAYPPALLCG